MVHATPLGVRGWDGVLGAYPRRWSGLLGLLCARLQLNVNAYSFFK